MSEFHPSDVWYFLGAEGHDGGQGGVHDGVLEVRPGPAGDAEHAHQGLQEGGGGGVGGGGAEEEEKELNDARDNVKIVRTKTFLVRTVDARINSSKPVAAALANVIWSRLIGMGRTRILFNVFMLMSDV